MPAAEIKLRPYQPSDFDTLLEIDHACFSPGIAYGRFELRVYLRSPGAFCVVAEAAGDTAGFILVERTGDRAHIITIDVLEAHRQQGVGSSLLRTAEKHAAVDGAGVVELETATANKPAVAFWHKHGYRETGIVTNYYGRGLDAFEMEKRLSGTRAAQ